MAMIERKIVEIEWNAENVGREVMGRLLGVEKVQYRDGPGLVYSIAGTGSGEIVRFKGATRLNQLLHASDVGKVIIVRYMGEDKSKEMKAGLNYPKGFIVAVDEDSINPTVITDADLPF